MLTLASKVKKAPSRDLHINGIVIDRSLGTKAGHARLAVNVAPKLGCDIVYFS